MSEKKTIEVFVTWVRRSGYECEVEVPNNFDELSEAEQREIVRGQVGDDVGSNDVLGSSEFEDFE